MSDEEIGLLHTRSHRPTTLGERSLHFLNPSIEDHPANIAQVHFGINADFEPLSETAINAATAFLASEEADLARVDRLSVSKYLERFAAARTIKATPACAMKPQRFSTLDEAASILRAGQSKNAFLAHLSLTDPTSGNNSHMLVALKPTSVGVVFFRQSPSVAPFTSLFIGIPELFGAICDHLFAYCKRAVSDSGSVALAVQTLPNLAPIPSNADSAEFKFLMFSRISTSTPMPNTLVYPTDFEVPFVQIQSAVDNSPVHLYFDRLDERGASHQRLYRTTPFTLTGAISFYHCEPKPERLGLVRPNYFFEQFMIPSDELTVEAVTALLKEKLSCSAVVGATTRRPLLRISMQRPLRTRADILATKKTYPELKKPEELASYFIAMLHDAGVKARLWTRQPTLDQFLSDLRQRAKLPVTFGIGTEDLLVQGLQCGVFNRNRVTELSRSICVCLCRVVPSPSGQPQMFVNEHFCGKLHALLNFFYCRQIVAGGMVMRVRVRHLRADNSIGYEYFTKQFSRPIFSMPSPEELSRIVSCSFNNCIWALQALLGANPASQLRVQSINIYARFMAFNREFAFDAWALNQAQPRTAIPQQFLQEVVPFHHFGPSRPDSVAVAAPSSASSSSSSATSVEPSRVPNGPLTSASLSASSSALSAPVPAVETLPTTVSVTTSASSSLSSSPSENPKQLVQVRYEEEVTDGWDYGDFSRSALDISELRSRLPQNAKLMDVGYVQTLAAAFLTALKADGVDDLAKVNMKLFKAICESKSVEKLMAEVKGFFQAVGSPVASDVHLERLLASPLPFVHAVMRALMPRFRDEKKPESAYALQAAVELREIDLQAGPDGHRMTSELKELSFWTVAPKATWLEGSPFGWCRDEVGVYFKMEMWFEPSLLVLVNTTESPLAERYEVLVRPAELSLPAELRKEGYSVRPHAMSSVDANEHIAVYVRVASNAHDCGKSEPTLVFYRLNELIWQDQSKTRGKAPPQETMLHDSDDNDARDRRFTAEQQLRIQKDAEHRRRHRNSLPHPPSSRFVFRNKDAAPRYCRHPRPDDAVIDFDALRRTPVLQAPSSATSSSSSSSSHVSALPRYVLAESTQTVHLRPNSSSSVPRALMRTRPSKADSDDVDMPVVQVTRNARSTDRLLVPGKFNPGSAKSSQAAR